MEEDPGARRKTGVVPSGHEEISKGGKTLLGYSILSHGAKEEVSSVGIWERPSLLVYQRDRMSGRGQGELGQKNGVMPKM